MTRSNFNQAMFDLEQLRRKEAISRHEWNALSTKIQEFADNCYSKEELEQTVGNPVFAIETNIDFLKRKCPEQEIVFKDIQSSLEKIKNIIKNE